MNECGLAQIRIAWCVAGNIDLADCQGESGQERIEGITSVAAVTRRGGNHFSSSSSCAVQLFLVGQGGGGEGGEGGEDRGEGEYDSFIGELLFTSSFPPYMYSY